MSYLVCSKISTYCPSAYMRSERVEHPTIVTHTRRVGLSENGLHDKCTIKCDHRKSWWENVAIFILALITDIYCSLTPSRRCWIIFYTVNITCTSTPPKVIQAKSPHTPLQRRPIHKTAQNAAKQPMPVVPNGGGISPLGRILQFLGRSSTLKL